VKQEEILTGIEMFELAIDPEKARKYRENSKPEDEKHVLCVEKMCAVRNMNKVMSGNNINILRDMTSWKVVLFKYIWIILRLGKKISFVLYVLMVNILIKFTTYT
jgi:hypothetical protein